MRGDKENLIVGLSLQFALDIMDYCEVLVNSLRTISKIAI